MNDMLTNYPVRPRWLRIYGWVALAFFVAAQVIAFRIAPPDRDMGDLVKILFVHVPGAWTAFIAFTCVFVASIMYLAKRDLKHDLFAAASAEIGTVFTALSLALGSIWGRPTWGVYWTWDPRILTYTVLLLIFISYLALRSFTEDEERRARWSAAVGILGFLNVPIVYMSVKWWRTLHQMQSTPSTVAPVYVLGLRLNAFAFLFVFLYFVIARYRAARVLHAVESRREEAALGVGEAMHV